MTGKYGTLSPEPEPTLAIDLADEQPEKTGSFGVVREAPEASAPQLGASAEPAKTGRYGVASVDPLTTGKYGIGLPERSATGKYGAGSGVPVVELGGAKTGAGEPAGGDQQLSTAEPVNPAPTAPSGPPEAEDPFASFATQETAKAKPPAAPVPAPADATGSGSNEPPNPFDVNPFDINPFDDGSGPKS
jgi:hypothetical protein